VNYLLNALIFELVQPNLIHIKFPLLLQFIQKNRILLSIIRNDGTTKNVSMQSREHIAPLESKQYNETNIS
jgi:hypothetical protein